MTPAEQVEAVRARLSAMQERLGRESVARLEKDDYLLMRLVNHAEDVLDRHAPMDGYPDCCFRPCIDVDAVLKAWLP